jgi:dipeptide/tripeptide permease
MPLIEMEEDKNNYGLISPVNNNAPSKNNNSSNLFTPVVLSILATETAERFAYFGFRAVLVLYFKLDLYLDDNTAISCFAYTTCLANFSPLLGALLADGPLGRFRTILWFGCLYALGLMILTYGAFLSHDDSDAYRAHGVKDSLRTLFWKRALTFVGLVMVCVGTGGIKPCVNIFGADQVALRDRSNPVDETPLREHEEEEIIGRTATTQTDMELSSDNEHAVREFFNFFYFCINVGALTSFSVIPIVKRNFGFGVAFLLSAIFMTLALALFYSRRNEYIYRPEDEEKSTLAMTFKMCFRLMRRKIVNRHQLVSQQSDVENDETEEKQIHILVERTSECHQEEDFQDEPLHFQSPRHSMLINEKSDSWAKQQMIMDDAQQALQILPIMAMLPVFWMLYDQQGSVWTLQARKMALHGLEPEQINLLNPLEIMLFIPLFDRIIYPAMEQRKINIDPLRRMGWGMLLAAISFVVSGFLEHILETSDAESIHVFWTVPQITILAVGEIFLSVTGLEYAYSRSPDRLKGFIMATYLLMIALGDLMGGILYSSVFRHMGRATAMYVCAFLMVLNRVIFGKVIVATQQQDPNPPAMETPTNHLEALETY